jgi:prolyl oligopeptidase
LGTPRSADTVVYQRPDQPSWQFSPTLSSDGRYLVVTISDGELGDRRQEQLAYFDLQLSPTKAVALIDRFDAEYVFLGNEGPVFYLLTTLQADTKRITLQASQSAAAPVLLRVWSQTGHGHGTTLSQRVEQNTEVLSFFAHALGLAHE